MTYVHKGRKPRAEKCVTKYARPFSAMISSCTTRSSIQRGKSLVMNLFITYFLLEEIKAMRS